MQTNGVLLDDEWINYLLEKKINVGISLDSTKESNDKYRVFHNGKSSYTEILDGFELLKKKSNSTPGLLSVIDIDEDPNKVYEHYKSIGANYINLLFPDETYDYFCIVTMVKSLLINSPKLFLIVSFLERTFDTLN